MATLRFYNSILSPAIIDNLRKKNIKTVSAFCEASPESLANITNLTIKEILELKSKLRNAFVGKIRSADEVYRKEREHEFELESGILELDTAFGKLQSGNVYEFCGKSGVGKTQLCLKYTANAALREKCVHYIDTKGDFSAHRLMEIIRKQNSDKKIISSSLGRVRITKIFDLYQLTSTLHWLKNQLKYCYVPLIIIDSIPALYNLTLGSEKPIGFAFLNHIESLLKYIASKHHSIILLTNLETQNFDKTCKSTKICMGQSWRSVCDTRFFLRVKNQGTINISLDQDLSFNQSKCTISVNNI